MTVHRSPISAEAQDRRRSWPLVLALGKQFTVYAVDRRGYGKSGDGPNYAIDCEFEDIAAVVDSAGEPVNY